MSRRPAILARGRQRALVGLLALAFGQAAAMVATAFATRDVFRFLHAGGDSIPVATLATVALSGFALAFFRALEGRVGEQAGQSYAAEVRRVLFQHVSRMPLSAIAKRRSGALALRYVGDLAAFKGWIACGIVRLISATINISAAFFVLYLLEPRLFVAALAPVATVLAGIWLLSGPLGAAHAELRARRARLAAAMAERLPQGIQLRRSGRMRVELKALDGWSARVAEAGIRRETLAATVRSLPEAGAGVASALCLGTCLSIGMGLPETVAALTTLGMIVWPLRQLAQVSDRRLAFVVASTKLDRMLEAPRIDISRKTKLVETAPAIHVKAACTPNGSLLDLRLERGEVRRLAGPQGSGKTALLRALAGFEAPFPAKKFKVFGCKPGAPQAGTVLYLGGQTAGLSGSLRREVTLGIGRMPDDDEIERALEIVGLGAMVERLGGLTGRVLEGRRNLSESEQSRLLLTRGLLACPDIALIDADDAGLEGDGLGLLLDHLRAINAAGLIVTTDVEHAPLLGGAITLGDDESVASGKTCSVMS